MLVMKDDAAQAKQLFLSLDSLYIKAFEAFYDDHNEEFKNRIEDMKRSIRDLENMVAKKIEQDKVLEVVKLLKEKGIMSEELENVI